MKSKKIITICSSASFYKDVLEIEKHLKKIGFMVKVPSTARKMKKSGNFDVSDWKTWFRDRSHYKKKTQLMKGHFEKVVQADAILVVNNKKNGINGYIGGNLLMELSLAFHYKKRIYILNDIEEDHPFAEEVFGLNPIFINGDLKRIKR